MHTPFRFSSLAAALALVLLSHATTARADITGGTITGPGGVNSPIGIFGGTLAEPSLTYTSVDYLDVSITVDGAGTYLISETPAFGALFNSTGVAWSGFTWELISGPPAAFVYNPASPTFSGIDFSSTFANATGSPTSALFTGGTLPSSSGFQPAIDITVAGPGTFVIRETPIAVPEPSSLVLLGFGAAAIVGLGCRSRRHSAAG